MARVEETEPNNPLPWLMTGETLTLAQADYRILTWTNNVYPLAGGWADQPLTWLVCKQAFDFIRETFTGRHTPEYKLDKLNRLQLAVLTWLEKEP